MAKNIIDMVLEKKDRLGRSPVEAGQNMTLAVAAMKGGIGSDAWQSYMMQFVEQNPPGHPVDPSQLARLLGNDNTLGDPVLDRNRAYLVANGICGATTFPDFDRTVFSIDNGLPNGIVCELLDCDTNAGLPAPTSRAQKGLRAKTGKYPKK